MACATIRRTAVISMKHAPAICAAATLISTCIAFVGIAQKTALAADADDGLKENRIERFAQAGFPFIDYHVHIRGGMTVQKAIDRQAASGIKCGVLRNIGKGWEMETDDQLREFLDTVEGKPLFVGIQVNDRDWMHRHSPELLKRLDYVLGDTMIMPMPGDQ